MVRVGAALEEVHNGRLTMGVGWRWAVLCLRLWPIDPPPPQGMHWKGRDLRGGPQRRVDGRLEEVAKAVGGGYCRLLMPLKVELGVRETVAGHRLGALAAAGGCLPPLPMHAPPPPPRPHPLPRLCACDGAHHLQLRPGTAAVGRAPNPRLGWCFPRGGCVGVWVCV